MSERRPDFTYNDATQFEYVGQVDGWHVFVGQNIPDVHDGWVALATPPVDGKWHRTPENQTPPRGPVPAGTVEGWGTKPGAIADAVETARRQIEAQGFERWPPRSRIS
jgi:hypothetical protein